MTRRELREHCFKMLFCASFYPAEEFDEQFERYFDMPAEDETSPEGVVTVLHTDDFEEEDKEYLRDRAMTVAQMFSDIDARIDDVAEGWKTKRMGKVDLSILRLAVYEMLYDDDIPEKVAINEAVELAKKFGQDESPSFINGILAKLVI